MGTPIVIERNSWLGYRWQHHGLGDGCDSTDLDDLLLLGMQSSRQSAGEHPLSQRTPMIGESSLVEAIGPDGPLVAMWSVRGAPHAHRSNQIDIIRDALAPLPSDDGGQQGVEAIEEVAAALQQVVTKKMLKGDASTQTAREVSPSLVQWCQRCKADHIPDGTFRAAGRQAQLVIGPAEKGSTATMLHPSPKVKQVTCEHPRLALLNAYFRVNGPTTKTLLRDWMAVGTQTIRETWDHLDDELVRIRVNDKRYDVPEPLVEAVRQAPPPKGVALVPPNDPYLRQVDRTLLIPDSSRRKNVYRPLSGPGALLVDGEVAGIWRYHRSEQQIVIESSESLTPAQKIAIETRGAALASSTGHDTPMINWASCSK